MAQAAEQKTPTLTVIIPVLNSAELLSSTLAAIRAGRRFPDELVVVDDASSDASAEVAGMYGARVLTMPRNRGPAACRNHAVLQTSGQILIFLDADTRVHDDTIALLEARLQTDSTLDAVIGAYDRTPSERGVCSQFHNLAHCYVHRSSAQDAQTFWSGCGAIRRSAFLRAGGFDEQYTRPSVEDIELGYRMTAWGARILLDPKIMVTHLKRWTVASACVTNVRDRGIPWMLLLLRDGRVPNDLNLTWRNRASAASTGLAMLSLAAAFVRPWFALGALVSAIGTLALQAGLLRFVCRGKSPMFVTSAFAFCLLQEACKVIAVVEGVAIWTLGPSRAARLSCVPLADQTQRSISESSEVPA